MADARKDKRTLLSLKIRYKSATLEDFIERYSGDISQGGVFIKAKKPLDVGTLLKFEFLLQDQSSLIHGVGRVVWRREPKDADSNNPAGMGIKFIKMDPQSRSLVQRIVEDRAAPGVFDQGSQPAPARQPSLTPLSTPVPDDSTKVRHVSEFLASAFEEGGAAEETMNEARAGAQRAREQSQRFGARRSAPARGVLGTTNETPTAKRAAAPEASSRSAMSAFGNGGSVSQALAEPMDELNADDDFLDDEQTRIHDYPDADATVVGGSAAGFLPERRQTPVVEAPKPSRLETEVPDLFGPDIANSFEPSGGLEPAPGEVLDSSLLDPAVPTVPPPAGVPQGPGIPAEAFKAPTERVPAADNPYAAGDASGAPERPKKPASRGGWRAVMALVAVVVIVGAGVAGWQSGALDNLRELAAPYIGDEIEVIEEPAPQAAAAPTEEPSTEAPADLDLTDEVEASADTAGPSTADSEAVPAGGPVKVVIESRPARAFVAVDGKPAGRAPITLTLEVGAEVTLVARARGYLPKTQKVTVEGDTRKITLALPTLPYFVEVSSDPPGARATAVGGGEITTPGEMRFKSMISPREIVVSKDGYETVTRTVSRREFREETKRMVTTIRVQLAPAGATETTAAPAEAAADSGSAVDAEASDAASAEDAPSGAPSDLSDSETTETDGLGDL
ncbi:MAG: TIGR02266 family protein [Myxococcota bacterium]